MAGKKWTPEQRKNFIAAMKRKREEKAKAPVLDRTHQAIMYLKAATQLIKEKQIHQVSQSEMYAYLAYKALTER